VPSPGEETMDASVVYQKTRKGEDEIKARAAKLPPKVRTMLIMVDGSKTSGQLAGIAKQLGVTEDYIALLEGQGLIAPAAGKAAAPAHQPSGAGAPPQDEFERFRAAKTFMNETVVNALGMRSFFFTLKLEKCGTRAELAGLVEDYGKAIAKASG